MVALLRWHWFFLHPRCGDFLTEREPLAARAGLVQAMQTDRAGRIRERAPREPLPVLKSGQAQHIFIKQGRMRRGAALATPIRALRAEIICAPRDADLRFRLCHQPRLHRRHILTELV